MEDCSISVEELNICFGENRVDKETNSVKEAETELQFERKIANSTESKPPKNQHTNKEQIPTWSRPNGQKIPTKYSPLPSLGQTTDRKVIEGFEQSREQQDAVWTLCTALNVPSKEQSPSVSAESQLLLCAKRSEYKPGKTMLAPLQDSRKQRPHSQGGNESFLLKTQSSPKGKYGKGENVDDHTVHFTPISKAVSVGQEDYTFKTDESSRDGIAYLSPKQGLKIEKASGSQQSRRFSLPVSPRLLRRFHKERLYSSKKTEERENDGRQNYPDKASIFSPPFKDLDAIRNDKNDDVVEAISKDLSKSDTKRGFRKSLDGNSMRFLSEIKVSLERESSPEPNLLKVKSKTVNYGLSASSETIFRESLPEVVPRPNSPCVYSGGRRNRASTFTSLEAVIPLETKTLGKTTLESPMLLESGTRRLSHLSLSPRLSRKR